MRWLEYWVPESAPFALQLTPTRTLAAAADARPAAPGHEPARATTRRPRADAADPVAAGGRVRRVRRGARSAGGHRGRAPGPAQTCRWRVDARRAPCRGDRARAPASGRRALDHGVGRRGRPRHHEPALRLRPAGSWPVERRGRRGARRATGGSSSLRSTTTPTSSRRRSGSGASGRRLCRAARRRARGRVRLQAGPLANVVTLSAGTWRTELRLAPRHQRRRGAPGRPPLPRPCSPSRARQASGPRRTCPAIATSAGSAST